jgi:hypothetical protein
MYVVIGVISIAIYQGGLTSYTSPTGIFQMFTSGSNVFVLSWQYAIMFLLGTISTIFSSGALGGLLLILLFCCVFVATIINCFKILWLMIKTYVSIVLSIAIAPFQILLGIVSPSGGGIMPWMKNFAANLAVYPVVGLLFFIAFFFIVQAMSAEGSIDLFKLLALSAPFQIKTGLLAAETSWDPPLTWGVNSGRFLWMLASYAIYMIIPKTAEVIKGFITGKEFAYGTAIGESFGPLKTGGTYAAAEYMNRRADAAKLNAQEIPAAVQVGRKVLGIKG